jgi:hypothetical protein
VGIKRVTQFGLWREHKSFQNERGSSTSTQTTGPRNGGCGWTLPACEAYSTSRSTARSGACGRSRTSPSSSSARPTLTATRSTPLQSGQALKSCHTCEKTEESTRKVIDIPVKTMQTCFVSRLKINRRGTPRDARTMFWLRSASAWKRIFKIQLARAYVRWPVSDV